MLSVLFQVVFTRTVRPFAELQKHHDKRSLHDSRYGLYFQSPSIQSHYYQLLEHECFVCRREGGRPFRTFGLLKDHMRKMHELFYCDLCVEHLKIFTFERRCYTRSELATHRRKGDTDNTSHRCYYFSHLRLYSTLDIVCMQACTSLEVLTGPGPSYEGHWVTNQK